MKEATCKGLGLGWLFEENRIQENRERETVMGKLGKNNAQMVRVNDG